jgi:hypothetical protein
MPSHAFTRCAFIVRGRAQSLLDDLLPAFALAVEASTPLPRDEFITKMRAQIQSLVPGGVDKKTADNYRTETIGQMLGMYYYDDKNIARIAPRAQRYLDTQDQVEFFKNICCLLQAPSGMSKETKEFIKKGISFWPISYLTRTLRLAKERYDYPSLTKKELNFFVFSNLSALCGKMSPEETVDEIASYRRRKAAVPIDGGSNTSQHSNEVLNLAKYANLVSFNGEMVTLNQSEATDADKILAYQNDRNWFDVESYDLESTNGWQTLNDEWRRHYAQFPFPNDVDTFSSKGSRWLPEPVELPTEPTEIPKTSHSQPDTTTARTSAGVSGIAATKYDEPVEITANEIGETGENYVFVQEQKRVKRTHSSELNRVKRVGMIKGIGYDVHSVLAARGRSKSEENNAIFIEVKSEFRSSPPKDSFVASLTANEFKAARQFKNTFYIFKVFLVGPAESQKIIVFSLQNPISQEGVAILPSDDGERYTLTFRRIHCEEVHYA